MWTHRWRASALSLLWLVAALGLAIMLAVPQPASAQARRDAQARDAQASDFDPAHKSLLKIPAASQLPVTRKVTLGADKSMIVEVPVDLQNVLVSNPEVIDAVVQTSRQVYILAKEMGEANAFFIGPDGQKVMFLEVTVARDLAALRDTMARLIPGSKIQAEMMGDNVVLSGSVMSPIDASRAGELAQRFVKGKNNVVNMLNTASKEQVLLKVQVAEIQRDALRRIGVDIPAALLNAGDFTFAKVMQNAFPVTSGIVPSAVAAASTAGVPGVNAGSAFQPSWTNGNQSVSAMIQALERTGALRTLAEPNLTAISGETAKFLAGGEFPVPIAQQNNSITVDWKQFGVNVSFKPVVLSEGKISLTITAEVSELSSDGAITLATISLPGLKVRRAETTLEIPSGGTIAMAGLLSDDTRQSVEGVPGLKNLPVLGALFRSNDYRRRETELVILVSPYIASHAAKQDLAKPNDGYMPSSELRELFFGHINRVYGHDAPPGRGRYQGDYGFIVDYPGVKG